MTTGREQARVTAEGALDYFLRHGGELTLPQTCADAASDVWEPLLRDLMDAVDMAQHQHTFLRQSAAYARAKEALG